jgi:2-phosphosulfolactate phosphatase
MASTLAIAARSRPSISTARQSSSGRVLARRGIVAASRAKRLYAASLVTAEATVRALRAGAPDYLSLVAMGDNGIKRTDEDELCAIHLRNRLEGRPGDADAIRRLILAGGEVGRFHDPARPYLHPEDVDIALDIDRYDFAVRVDFEDGRPVARIETPAVTMPKSPT